MFTNEHLIFTPAAAALFLMGSILAVVTYRTKSLYPAILAHGVYDAIGLFLLRAR